MSMQSRLEDIGLVQYAQPIQDHGFETRQDLVNITESDLEQIGILLGHRRKLQRVLHLFSARANGRSAVSATYKQQHQKRRYRSHPKRDPYTPVRPKTAYQLFAGEVRRQMQDHGLTFAESAKSVGTRWAMQSAEKRNTLGLVGIESGAAVSKSVTTLRSNARVSTIPTPTRSTRSREST